MTPKARQEGIVGWENGLLKIKVTAPPDKGAANRAVIKLLASALALPQRSIILLKGETTRQKLFLIEGVDSQTIKKLGVMGSRFSFARGNSRRVR